MNQKGFVLLYILIGILILIGIAGGAYYLWAQEYRRTHPIGPLPIVVPENIPLSRNIDETATWKTYTNTEYGFSIKYPDFITYKEKLFNDVTFYYKIDDEDILFGKAPDNSSSAKEIGIEVGKGLGYGAIGAFLARLFTRKSEAKKAKEHKPKQDS